MTDRRPFEAPRAELHGARVALTPLALRDVHTCLRWNNDPELNRFDSEEPFRRESLGQFLPRFEAIVYDPRPDVLDFAIRTHGGDLIGLAFADRLCLHSRHCRVGVSICERAYQRRGYGKDALIQLVQHLFDEWRIHRIAAESFAYNISWRVLLARLGFRCEERLRDYLYRDGRYWDKEVFALLDTEFRAGSPARTAASIQPLQSG